MKKCGRNTSNPWPADRWPWIATCLLLYNQPSAGFSHISMVPNEITQNKTICDNSHITLHVIKIELLFKLKCHIKHFHTSTFIEQEYTTQFSKKDLFKDYEKSLKI